MERLKVNGILPIEISKHNHGKFSNLEILNNKNCLWFLKNFYFGKGKSSFLYGEKIGLEQIQINNDFIIGKYKNDNKITFTKNDKGIQLSFESNKEAENYFNSFKI